MSDDEIFNHLKIALESIGVPAISIFREMEVCAGEVRPYRADLLVAANDKKTPLFVFEIKKQNSLDLVYQRARRQMAGVLGLVSCFVVAQRGKEILMAKICDYEISKSEWVNLSDRFKLRKLVGDYYKQSEIAIRKNGGIHQDLEQFRNGIVVSGTLIILVSYLIEIITGKVMSYQLMGFIGLIFVLYAASYGIIKDINVGRLLSFRCADDLVKS